MTWFTCRSSGVRAGEVGIYDDIGGGGIDAGAFIDSVKKLGPLDKLTVRLSSGGGEVFQGLALYNFLKGLDTHITTQVDGLAASIASVIFMAGSERHMPENSWLMIHDPSGFAMGSAKTMEKTADILHGIKKSLVNIYTRETGLSADEISSLMEEETWLDGPAAFDRKFATKVTDAIQAAANVDTSRFSKVPQQLKTLFARGDSTHPPHERKISMSATENTAPAAEPKPENIGHKRDAMDIADQIVASMPPPEPAIEQRRPWNQKGNDPEEEEREKVKRQTEIAAEAKRLADQRMEHVTAALAAGKNLGLESEAQRLIQDSSVDPEKIPTILINVFSRTQHLRNVEHNLMPTGASVGFSNDDPTIVRERMSDAIAAQFVNGYKARPDSDQYRNWRVQDMMRNVLERRGVSTRSMSRSDIVDAALHTTSDFPNILGTAANKIFLGSYEAAPATYRSIAGRQDFANFQVFNLLRDGDFPTLKEVVEDGQFTYGTMTESKETGQLKTHGRTFAISRQALINDTLGVFGRIVAKIGQAVARFENKTVWAIVTSSPALSDGDALYHANHSNVGTGVISATSIGAGRAAMRTQTSLDGEVINAAPRYIAVPAAKETTAEQVIMPLTIPTSAADIGTTSMRQLQIVVEPLLDASSALIWYLFADPAVGAAIQYGYLEGDSAPRVRVNDPFNVDGVEFQVRLDFHAEAVDYRYTFRSTGAP